MKAIGIKFIVERQDNEITTWHDVFEHPAEKILKDVMWLKAWENGTVREAYLEFDNGGEYYKIFLDCKPLTQVLKTEC